MQNQTEQFFHSLYATKPDDSYVLVWRLAGKLSRWFKNIDAAAAYATENATEDLYVEVGLCPKDDGPTSRCPASKVIGIPALWIDFDVASPAHQKTNLPRTATEALSVLPLEFPPSMVVHSGHGIHAWWIFKEIELIEDEDDRARLAGIIKKWERCIRLRAQVKGWTIDATHDLARILRIPGTMNNKLRKEGQIAECQIYSLNNHRYNVSEFETYLEGIGSLDEDPALAARAIAAPTVSMDGLILDGARELAPARLAAMMSDKRFAETWAHKRSDMTADESQSAYDLAIGNILFEGGCSDQDIVDAMIHNRRDRGARSKLRLDYYQRTLSKIHRKKRGAITADEVAATPAAAAATDAQPDCDTDEPPPPLRDEERGALYEKLSTLLHLLKPKGKKMIPDVLRILKVKGSKPIWRIELKSGGVISFLSASGFLDQGRMRVALYTATNQMMPRYKTEAWDAVIRTWSESVIEIEAGAENTDNGIMNYIAEQYLIRLGVKASPAAAFANVKNNYAPFEYEGRIAISALDLMDWAARVLNIKKELNEIVHLLSTAGAECRDFSLGAGRAKQTRWLMPERFQPNYWREKELMARATLGEPMEV